MNLFRDASGVAHRQCYLCNEVKPDGLATFADRWGQKTKLSCTSCNHALPELHRDRPNPMFGVAEKACKRCERTQPNDFHHFGAKLWRGRDEVTTVDVCLECADARRAATIAAKIEDERAIRESRNPTI